jgi:hypothetical protein
LRGSGKWGSDVREVTSSLGVFRLLFGKMPSERDDVGVDLLGRFRRRKTVTGGHLSELRRIWRLGGGVACSQDCG